MGYAAVVIGASQGGLEVINEIFRGIPLECIMPILVAQHRHHHSGNVQIENLNQVSHYLVGEAEEKDQIAPRRIYFAPSDYHLLVEKNYSLSLSYSEEENHSRPSIDVLFSTASLAFKERLVGVLLSGNNTDGALGMKEISENKGMTIIQNPKTSEASGMPESALKIISPDYVEDAAGIRNLLVEILANGDTNVV